MMSLYPWQERCVADAVEVIDRGEHRLYSAPTGSGKSYVLIETRRRLEARHPDNLYYIVSPREEILLGLLEKLIERPPPTGATDRERLLAEHGLWTPIKLRNRLYSGEVPWAQGLLIDEGHHALAETYGLLRAMHGYCGSMGVSATAYRGTPQETKELHELWGKPHVALSWADARAMGYVAIPKVEIRPLFDDDVVALNGANFAVGGAKGLNASLGEHLAALAGLVAEVWESDPRPTILALPTTELVERVGEYLDLVGVPHDAVTQATSSADRQVAFARCCERESVLVQIGVVGEGVDLPLRILIDAKPTMSSVAWMQLVGRITRPVPDGEPPPRVIELCRNVERHAYLLEGMLPRTTVAESQREFGGSSYRSALRRLGLEAVKRFKTAVKVPTIDGAEILGYNLYMWDELTQRKQEYFVLLDPSSSNVFCAVRYNAAKADGSVKYGPWRRCDLPGELNGFRTARTGECSEKQLAWWARSAASRNIDPEFIPDRRTFAVLPVLLQTRFRL